MYTLGKPETLTVALLKKLLREPKIRRVGNFMVTQEVAAYLMQNPKLLYKHQRQPTDHHIAKLMEEMGEKWWWTGESMSFLDDGTLGNGQHRIAAVARTGIEIEVVVVFGVPVAAYIAIDQGRKRSVVNIFEAANVKNPHDIAPAAAWAVRIENGAMGVLHNNSMRHPARVLQAYFDRYQGLQDFRDEARRLYGNNRKHNRALTIALCLAFHRADPELAPEFIEQWIKGVSDPRFVAIEEAERAFSNYRAKQQKAVDPRIVCASMITAWNAVKSGRRRRGDALWELPTRKNPKPFPQLLTNDTPAEEAAA